MTFYQELQLNQAGSKELLRKSETAGKALSRIGLSGKGCDYNAVLLCIRQCVQHFIW